MVDVITSREEWSDNQVYEKDWWRLCTNTFAEETKQISYAHRMGLINEAFDGEWPSYNLHGKSIVDVGGGPTSILLKCIEGADLLVIDPCEYPDWVHARYDFAGIDYLRAAGEDVTLNNVMPFMDFDTELFDEAWMYNCLQHTMNPELIISNMKTYAKKIRIFEWVNIPPHKGHPHELKAEKLDAWLGGRGIVEKMDENGCNATAYYGEFDTGA